jgi:hypothetical protein
VVEQCKWPCARSLAGVCRCICEADGHLYANLFIFALHLSLGICRIGQYGDKEQLGSSQQLLHRVFTTVYMGTENSSAETRQRAATLAEQVGAVRWHTVHMLCKGCCCLLSWWPVRRLQILLLH